MANAIGGGVAHQLGYIARDSKSNPVPTPVATPRIEGFLRDFDQQLAHLAVHGGAGSTGTVAALMEAGQRIKQEVSDLGSFTMPRDPSDDVLALLSSLSISHGIEARTDHGLASYAAAAAAVPGSGEPADFNLHVPESRMAPDVAQPLDLAREQKLQSQFQRGLETFRKFDKSRNYPSPAEFRAAFGQACAAYLGSALRAGDAARRREMLTALCNALTVPVGKNNELASAGLAFLQDQLEPALLGSGLDDKQCKALTGATRTALAGMKRSFAMSPAGQVEALELPADLLASQSNIGKSRVAAADLWLKAIEDIGRAPLDNQSRISLFTELRKKLEAGCDEADARVPDNLQLGDFEWSLVQALASEAGKVKGVDMRAVMGPVYGKGASYAQQARHFGGDLPLRPAHLQAADASKTASFAAPVALATPAASAAQIEARIRELTQPGEMKFADLKSRSVELAIDINLLGSSKSDKGSLFLKLHHAVEAAFERKRAAYPGVAADVKPHYAEAWAESREAIDSEIRGYLGGPKRWADGDPAVAALAQNLADRREDFYALA
ncbi:MAG: hypothetical protein EOO28_21040 [Comamonadaceae bacterium]|nr:MAG: hypothetical protein EOO28_21040 [Comamonadaceae bacterium]